ncbi:hypothetical protein Tco_0298590 [Tanacetum coccineum]
MNIDSISGKDIRLSDRRKGARPRSVQKPSKWKVEIIPTDLWHAPWLSDQLEWNLWHAPWLSDQLEWNLWHAPWLSDQLEWNLWPKYKFQLVSMVEIGLKEVARYKTSEEESVERPRERDLYEFVNHPQLQQRSHRNEFAPRWLPQSSGNMNGWLVEDEDEVERNEVDSDLESTASSKPSYWEGNTKDDRDCASYHCP